MIASGLHRPNGVAFHDGSLFVAELSKIWRYDNIEANLDHPPKPVLIYDDLPTDEAHGWKFIGIGPDNKLYVPIGSPGNITMPPPTHAQIRRMDLDGKNVEMVATGVRNSVGFDWNPTTQDMYFTNNGRDWVSRGHPRTTRCTGSRTTEKRRRTSASRTATRATSPIPNTAGAIPASEFAKPAALLGRARRDARHAVLHRRHVPRSYKGAIFVARHGSWNRTRKLGGDVVVVKLKEDGSVASIEPFLTGFLQDNKYVGRPVDVQQMADGSLLVSDDWNGAIWRVSYGK